MISGADTELSRKRGWKPIHAACYGEFEDLLKLLVEYGASLSSRNADIRNYTPLHILISTEKPPFHLVDYLVKKGAKLNATDDNKETPLHLAAFWGHYDICELLVSEVMRNGSLIFDC